MTYSEKLRDPRWQKKRLEILSRDKFTCQICEDNETTLHVHHRVYIKGKEPWGYPDWCLVTLCSNCHNDETEMGKGVYSGLEYALAENGFFNSDVCDLSIAFHENKIPISPVMITDFMHYLLSDGEFREKCFGLYHELKRSRNAKIKKSNG